MKAPVSHSKDPDLLKAPQALLRAAEKAKKLAEQTGTPFVVRQAAKPIATDREMPNKSKFVTPAKAGVQSSQ